jgi:hypothetical protein
MLLKLLRASISEDYPMNGRAPKVLAVPVAPDFVKSSLELGDDLACPVCQTSLEIHQPDLDMPERLLGSCPSCRNWTIVDIRCDGQMALTALPHPEWSN